MDKYGDIVKMWQGWDVQTEADIDLRLHNFRILFAYNSGKIENEVITYHDSREIFENGRVLNFTGDPRTIFELSNQKMCYEYLKPKLAAKEPLSLAIIKETHGALTGGTYDERRFVERGERPGEFKKHDYITGLAEAGSPHKDVENDLTELLAELAECGGADIITAAAYFHARFEYIHPFADGNGRAGRALLNYFFIINNHPPVIIYNEDKADYYDALAAYDASEDLRPMTDFMRRQIVRTWDRTLEIEQRRM